MNRQAIVKARQQRAESNPGELPGGNKRVRSFPGKLTARLVERNGRQFYHLNGFATVFERAYDMWDAFGEYREIMDYNALTKSLSMNPDVAWLVNHRGVTMARTTNGTLELGVKPDESGYHGLNTDAWLNPERQDVRDIVSAVVDELVDEMSFAFQLNDGIWNDDYSEFRITEADINRGDVSAVNYGANPYTSIHARTADILEDIERLPVPALGRAQAILTKRVATAVERSAIDLSEAARGRYERSAAILARAMGEDFNLADVADESDEDTPVGEPEERSADKSDLVHIPGGKSLNLWKTRLSTLKESD